MSVTIVQKQRKSQISFEIGSDAFSIGSSATVFVDAPSGDSSSLDEEIRKYTKAQEKKKNDQEAKDDH